MLLYINIRYCSTCLLCLIQNITVSQITLPFIVFVLLCLNLTSFKIVIINLMAVVVALSSSCRYFKLHIVVCRLSLSSLLVLIVAAAVVFFIKAVVAVLVVESQLIQWQNLIVLYRAKIRQKQICDFGIVLIYIWNYLFLVDLFEVLTAVIVVLLTVVII